MDKKLPEDVRWLTGCPASDGNFKAALKRATNKELRQAEDILLNSSGKCGVSRLTAVQREIRRRAKLAGPSEQKVTVSVKNVDDSGLKLEDFLSGSYCKY